MDKSDYQLTDLKRILFGEAPAAFLLEVVIRTLIIYFVVLLIMRYLGKRMSGQVSILDLAITIMLGAIIAPPTQTPERGIIQGIVILFLVLGCHRLVTLWGVKNDRIENLTHGTLTVFVKDGILQTEELKNTRISRAQLFSALREQHVYNLGQVERMYLEACGVFTVFKNNDARPGLSTLPPKDDAVREQQQKNVQGYCACTSCGTVRPLPAHLTPEKCPHCGHPHWDNAVI